jgi:hypothetical protein
MPDSDRTDKSSYAPFILADDGKYKSLILTDRDMIAKTHVFEERKAEGWIGSGYDWTSVARGRRSGDRSRKTLKDAVSLLRYADVSHKSSDQAGQREARSLGVSTCGTARGAFVPSSKNGVGRLSPRTHQLSSFGTWRT